MRTRFIAPIALCFAFAAPACSSSDAGGPTDNPGDEGSNPFLDDQENRGKEDTGYMNPDGTEVEVDVEGDTTVTGYQLKKSPAYLAQFATTYLRKRGEFYLESLAEQATAGDRAEWLVDGTWLSAQEASSVDASKLTHWRVRGMNAVLLHSAASGVGVGSQFEAKIPLNPFTVMQEAGDKCGEKDNHIGLSSSVYWYLWDPDLPTCTIATQQMKLTVSKMTPAGKTVYPEYDKLIEDGKITAVVLFGQIGDGAISDTDIGVRGMKTMASWLTNASFKEVTPAPVGRRFTKHVGEVDFEIDLYSPYDFSGLSDYAHLSNFEKAVTEHEIIAYDGHSMLGASDFWARPAYPQSYQIFLYGGCLGYEYYVEPIVKKKGGWENLDLMSSVVEVSAGANEFAGPVFAKMLWALEHNYAASWKDILVSVRQRVGDSTFGVSGVNDNCFSPGGSLCGSTPDPATAKTYESTAASAIPDNDSTGITSVIDVPDAGTASSIQVDLDVTHTWVGDLKITLEHGGTTATLWDKAGGSQQDIKQTFALAQFANKEVSGAWTLRIVDTAAQDSGTLNRWSVIVTP